MSEYVKVGGQEWNERDGAEMLIDDVVLLDEENDGGTASSHSLHLSAYHSSPPVPYHQCHHRPCIPTAHRAAAIESPPLRLGPIKRRSRESCHPCNHELIKACDVLRPSLSSINLSYPCALFNCLLRRASREENETNSI